MSPLQAASNMLHRQGGIKAPPAHMAPGLGTHHITSPPRPMSAAAAAPASLVHHARRLQELLGAVQSADVLLRVLHPCLASPPAAGAPQPQRAQQPTQQAPAGRCRRRWGTRAALLVHKAERGAQVGGGGGDGRGEVRGDDLAEVPVPAGQTRKPSRHVLQGRDACMKHMSSSAVFCKATQPLLVASLPHHPRPARLQMDSIQSRATSGVVLNTRVATMGETMSLLAMARKPLRRRGARGRQCQLKWSTASAACSGMPTANLLPASRQWARIPPPDLLPPPLSTPAPAAALPSKLTHRSGSRRSPGTM